MGGHRSPIRVWVENQRTETWILSFRGALKNKYQPFFHFKRLTCSGNSLKMRQRLGKCKVVSAHAHLGSMRSILGDSLIGLFLFSLASVCPT